MPERKQFNFNTALLAIVNILVLVIAFFSKHELERLEEAQNKLWAAIMPRHEIEIQIQEIKTEQSKCEAKLLDLQARQTVVEINLVKLQQTK